MRISFFIYLLLILYSCSNEKKVYWCGDHACINHKERKLYFKKTMTVELKKINYEEINNDSEAVVKILNKEENTKKISKKDDKELIKQILLEEKNREKEEKRLAKQKLQDEKNREKEEKRLTKQKLREKKSKIEKEKKLAKKNKKNKPSNSLIVENDSSNNDFNKLLEIVTNRNMFRPFPDINDIPK